MHGGQLVALFGLFVASLRGGASQEEVGLLPATAPLLHPHPVCLEDEAWPTSSLFSSFHLRRGWESAPTTTARETPAKVTMMILF